MLHMLPEGLGNRITSTKKGLTVDFDINDVGPPGRRMRYYVEVAVAWTFEPQTPATMLSIGNAACGCENGRSPGTYRYHRCADALSYFKFVTPTVLGRGHLDTDHLVLHAHQSMLNEAWIVSGADALDVLRSKLRTLKKFDELGSMTATWPATLSSSFSVYAPQDTLYLTDLQELKHDLSEAFREADDARVICRATPNLACGRYDRQVSFDCNVRSLNVSSTEPIVVVAFNRRLEDSEGSCENKGVDPFCGENSPVANQHTIVRGYFVPDSSEIDGNAHANDPVHYPIPSMYCYGTSPRGANIC